jgi:hypothetical protein
MACAVQARKQDRRHNAHYAIVLTHTECASIKPTIAAASRNLPRKTDLREVVNVLLHISSSGPV